MNNETLIRDPVFQLNVLLWMAKEQPLTGYRVRPVFFELDFKVIYIEQPFPLPEETIKVIQASGQSISIAPVPELILKRDRDGKALYFEAKADSFGPDRDNARQARGHLLATGPAFQEVLSPLTSALLCYVVPDDKRTLMFECLNELAQALRSAGLAPGSFSSHGLRVFNRSLDYVLDSAFSQYTGAAGGSISIIDELEEDTDPSPCSLFSLTKTVQTTNCAISTGAPCLSSCAHGCCVSCSPCRSVKRAKLRLTTY